MATILTKFDFVESVFTLQTSHCNYQLKSFFQIKLSKQCTFFCGSDESYSSHTLFYHYKLN